MFYYQIALRQVRDVYTWHSTTPLALGARVEVPFRNNKKLGIVVGETPQPNFKTAAIANILDEKFISSVYLRLAHHLSRTHFTPLGKVLSLMIPEAYFIKECPAKYKQLLRLSSDVTENDLRHPTQKKFYEHLVSKSSVIWDTEVPSEFKNTAKTFLKKEWLTLGDKQLKPEFSLSLNAERNTRPLELTPAQTEALDQLKKSSKGTLLWGVTGSGKTEIYKHYFASLLKEKSEAQFLFLLPEIALTPQLIEDFQRMFGHKVAVWHSNLTAGEKVQAFARIQSGVAKILIGTRSAALVPIPNLKAIVVDEEHEWTFKNEFNPRFWTHEVVEFLAKDLKIPFVYGSATPKLRTYHLVESKTLDLIHLPERVHKTALPTIELVDLKQEGKRGNFSPISGKLQSRIIQAFESGKQVVLFLNKRGFSGSAMCRFCGDAFACNNCDMSLKMHRNGSVQRLICHVCGFMKAFPKSCDSCQKQDFVYRGWGTQQLESQLKELFPKTKLFRADRDSITGRYDFEKLLSEFKSTPQSILLGTQMIAKGLDFSDVALVGIVMADVGLHLPDHHAEERVYQLLEQVSGRAGRRHTQGHIVVQTYQPDLPLFGFLINHDTQGFMAQKYAEHQKLKLPPLSDVIKIIVVDHSKATAFANCKNLHTQLVSTLKDKKLEDRIEATWAPAFFPKLHNKYWFYVFLKSEDKEGLTKFIQNYPWPEGIKIDVSPTSLI